MTRRTVPTVAAGAVLVGMVAVGCGGAPAPAAAPRAPTAAATDRIGPQGATAGEPAQRLAAATSGVSPSIAGCTVFPATSAWNTDVSAAPLHPESGQIIATIQSNGGDFLHPDFGGDGQYGIPITIVGAGQPLVPIVYEAYGGESDPGPFPIPPGALVEGGSDSGGDRHVLVVQQGSCVLFELFRAFPDADGSWHADSGARWDLASAALRPLGWTSADAAGLPIAAGLVRFDEVAAGRVDHAVRVTFSRTQMGYILPATHYASDDTDPLLPPMGMRLRLKASYDLGGLTGQSRVIAEAMQRYGLIVADNGSNWFFQGETDPRWDDDDLSQLKSIPGSAFEVVDTGPVLS